MTELAKQAVKIITKKAPGFRAKVGIVLGSGLGILADHLENAIILDYKDLPGFPECTVAGHGGQLFLGELKGIPVACLQGRAHYYEGAVNETVKTYIRTLKLLGCETLLATNSSGSLRPEVLPGNLVVINDHINYQFTNILVGPNDEEFGPRFIGMEDTYDPELRKQLAAAAKKLNIPITEGIYFGVLGPTFETPAEIRAYRTMGGEVIGMSTLPEVISARHCGLRVAVVAVITNMAAGMNEVKLSHEVTLEGAKAGRDKLVRLIETFLKHYH